MSDANFKFDREELLAERSLFDVYKIARLNESNRVNVAIALTATFISAIYCLIDRERPDIVLGLIRQLVGDAITFSASILGFLIAGFTIFVTGKPEVFQMMAKVQYDNTRVSYLKYNLSIFMVVFIHYLSFTVLSFFIRIFCGPGGPAYILLKICQLPPERFIHLRSASIFIAFVLLTGWFFYIIMLLKSFVFNVYHSVMTGIALTIEDDD